MRKIEKYVLWLSILSLVVIVASFFGLWSMFSFRDEKVVDWSSRITSYSFEFLFNFLPNVVCAFWLAWAAIQNRLRKLPWVLLAFVHGIYGVILFYILLGYFELRLLNQKLKQN